jgi:adenylate cyclase
MERRLAAILIADVVGYSRLSQIDEEGTRVRFQADQNDVFEPAIERHHGRLVKTMGDGLLVEFQSVVDALRCAVEVQQLKTKQRAAALPEHRLEFRIGINLGDIIVEGEDIQGDGVNIADRIQALAEPGGISISGTTYDQVKSKIPVGFASLGEQRLKSITEPVRVYRVLLDPTLCRHRSVRCPCCCGRSTLVAAMDAGKTGGAR